MFRWCWHPVLGMVLLALAAGCSGGSSSGGSPTTSPPTSPGLSTPYPVARADVYPSQIAGAAEARALLTRRGDLDSIATYSVTQADGSRVTGGKMIVIMEAQEPSNDGDHIRATAANACLHRLGGCPGNNPEPFFDIRHVPVGEGNPSIGQHYLSLSSEQIVSFSWGTRNINTGVKYGAVGGRRGIDPRLGGPPIVMSAVNDPTIQPFGQGEGNQRFLDIADPSMVNVQLDFATGSSETIRVSRTVITTALWGLVVGPPPTIRGLSPLYAECGIAQEHCVRAQHDAALDDGGRVYRRSGNSFSTTTFDAILEGIARIHPRATNLQVLAIAFYCAEKYGDRGAPGTDPVFGRGVANLQCVDEPFGPVTTTRNRLLQGIPLTQVTLPAVGGFGARLSVTVPASRTALRSPWLSTRSLFLEENTFPDGKLNLLAAGFRTVTPASYAQRLPFGVQVRPVMIAADQQSGLSLGFLLERSFGSLTLTGGMIGGESEFFFGIQPGSGVFDPGSISSVEGIVALRYLPFENLEVVAHAGYREETAKGSDLVSLSGAAFTLGLESAIHLGWGILSLSVNRSEITSISYQVEGISFHVPTEPAVFAGAGLHIPF